MHSTSEQRPSTSTTASNAYPAPFASSRKSVTWPQPSAMTMLHRPKTARSRILIRNTAGGGNSEENQKRPPGMPAQHRGPRRSRGQEVLPRLARQDVRWRLLRQGGPEHHVLEQRRGAHHRIWCRRGAGPQLRGGAPAARHRRWSAVVPARMSAAGGDGRRQAPQGAGLPASQGRTSRAGHGTGPSPTVPGRTDRRFCRGLPHSGSQSLREPAPGPPGRLAGYRDIPVRWGGEEFLALLPGTDQAGLRATAERVRMLVENSWIQRGEVQVRVTISVGATMAAPTETADDLVDRADGLMYASKKGGRNRVTTDAGALISRAERPILGTAVPWETPSG